MRLLPKPTPKCEECGVGAKVTMLFSRTHVCGRACLKRAQEAFAKTIVSRQEDSA